MPLESAFTNILLQNYFDRPSYQNETVPSYIRSLDGEHDGLYNERGRGYPDVAAIGSPIAIVQADSLVGTGVKGTSASGPIFVSISILADASCLAEILLLLAQASVIALVNDALLAHGKPVLGFLNPWIYGGAHSVVTDVVTGSSKGVHIAPTTWHFDLWNLLTTVVLRLRWSGIPGEKWMGCRQVIVTTVRTLYPDDRLTLASTVTGWGTPNFRELVDYALAKQV